MHRTEAQNNMGGLFTDGPPGTTLGSAWLNAVQEEILKVIEMSGITPRTQGTETRDQLYNALISDAFWTKMGLTVTKATLNSLFYLFKGQVIRPSFEYVDDDQIYIHPGMYHHAGSIEQTVYWNSKLNYKLGPGGDNPDSDALGASDWYYIYIDDSVVAASGPILTDASFVAKTTEPAWSDAKHGWYNGLDRCIFAVKTDGASHLIAFAHDGGDFIQQNISATITDSTPSNVRTAVTLDVPVFCAKGCSSITVRYVDTAAYLVIESLSPLGAVYVSHATGPRVDNTMGYNTVFLDVHLYNDSGAFKYYVYWSAATVGNTVAPSMGGWFFPMGM